MAVNKVITNKASTYGALKNCIAYVLKEAKTKDKLVAVTGTYAYEEIKANFVANAFIDEKKLWNKVDGRLYMHSAISWHKNEKITPELAFEIATNIAENDPFYKDFQTLVAVHQDRDHVHAHLVSNTVSYIDGHKEHHSKKDLEALMLRTNEYCSQYGLSVNQKGKHFDGTDIERLDIASMNNRKYRVITDSLKTSYMAECMLAIEDVKKKSVNKQQFSYLMKEHGWNVNWAENRKYITFSDESGHKIRNSNLGKTFNVDISKESLLDEFERNKQDICTEEFTDGDESESDCGYISSASTAITGATSVAVGVAAVEARRISRKVKNEQQKKAARL